MRGIRGRFALSFLLAGALTLVFGAAQASAATEVSLFPSPFGSFLEIFDQTADDDAITVSQDGTTITVTDTGTGGATAGPGCSGGGTTVTCPLDPPDPAPPAPPSAPVASVGLTMSDGTDSFTNQNLDANVGENDSGTVGNKTVSSGPADDGISVGLGNDTVDTGPGFDFVSGDDGNDTISTGPEGDSAEGGQGSDTVDTGEGNDSINEQAFANGSDVLNGGPGPSDFLSYCCGHNPVTIILNDQADDGHAGEGDNAIGIEDFDGTQGPDLLVGNDVENGIFGDDGNDVLSGLGGADGLDPGDDDDQADGGDGGDSVDAGTSPNGADVYAGGAGSDLIDYCCGLDGVNVAMNGQPDDGRAGEGDNVSGFEGFEGSDGPDTITADGSSNFFAGHDGNDLLVGNGGGDDYFAGPGDDTLISSGGSSLARAAEGSLGRALARRDDLQCDLGFDVVAADARDVVGADCERRGAEIVSDSARVNKKGKTKVRVSCPAEEGAPCNGKLALLSNGKQIGKGKYKIANGKEKNVKAKLSKKGKKALSKAKGSLLVSAEARTTEPPGVTANGEDVLLTKKGKKKGGGGKR